jgi:ribosomal protein RSM22 (predicted rRNA methylase)
LCAADGTARQQLVTKSEGAYYRAARKAAWGDRWEAGTSPDDGAS